MAIHVWMSSAAVYDRFHRPVYHRRLRRDPVYQHAIKIDSAEAAAMALAPLAGQWASYLFAVGLFNASLFAAAILPLSTAYFVCEAFGFEAGIDKDWEEAPVFYWLFTIFVIAGRRVVFIPQRFADAYHALAPGDQWRLVAVCPHLYAPAH